MPKGVYQRKPTYKQLRSLYFTLPGPIGLGMSMREASERLGLTPTAVFFQMKSFKKSQPKAWETVRCMLNVMKRQGLNLSRPLKLSGNGYRRWSKEVKEWF